MDRIRQEQDIILKSRYVTLRPPVREDWDVMLDWNDELELRYYSDDVYSGGDDIVGYKLEHLQQLYHGEDREKYHFIIDFQATTVGGCWLHKMDMDRIICRFPDLDLRRIDLFIADSIVWDKGVGTEVVRILTEFGFEQENADILLACDVPDSDLQSKNAFSKNGYVILDELILPQSTAKLYDLMLMRETYEDKSIS
jgi:RimJ/RimL family protein N-acetyltransferase